MTGDYKQQAADAGASLQMESSPPAWWVVALAVAVILAAHVVGRVGSFCSPIHADSYAYSCIGYRIAQGGVFYSPQLSDIKPPGLYHLYALAYLFLPSGRASMIPFDSLFGLLGYWAVYLLAKDLYGSRIGLVVTVTSVLVINACAVWDFGTEAFGLAESFMVFPAAMAVRHYRRSLVGRPMALAVGPRTGRPFVSPTAEAVGHPFMHFIWCGFWIGVELSIKQTALPLVATLAVHWTGFSLLTRSGLRRWSAGSALMIGGVLIALAPWVVMLLVQGTFSRVLQVLGPGAMGQLSKFTAFPDQWSNIMPLWVPMVWGVLGLVWCMESLLRGSRGETVHSLPMSWVDLSFLLIWFAGECVMLAYLPFRSFHYYVVSCLPLVLFSGTLWASLAALRSRLDARKAFACLSAAAVLSIAFGRIMVDTIVPMAIGRYRTYDAAADQAYFDEMVSRKIINFGVPPVEPRD